MIRFFEKLYKKDKDSFLALLRQNLDEEQRMFIVTANLLTDSAEYERMSKASNPYGDGSVSWMPLLQNLLLYV